MKTVQKGLGKLLMGIIVLTIAGTIMFLVINGIEANKIKKEQERKQREKIDGLN